MNLKQLYLGGCIPVQVALIALEAKEPWWQGPSPRAALSKMPLSVALVTLKRHLLGLWCSFGRALNVVAAPGSVGSTHCLQTDDTWHVSSTDTFACQKTYQVLQDVFLLLHLQGGLPLSIFQRTPHALKPLVDCTGLSC